MSHFEKVEYFYKEGGVNFFKHDFIFELREELPRVNLPNSIYEIYTQGFFSNFKNKAVFEKIDTILFL